MNQKLFWTGFGIAATAAAPYLLGDYCPDAVNNGLNSVMNAVNAIPNTIFREAGVNSGTHYRGNLTSLELSTLGAYAGAAIGGLTGLASLFKK